MADITEALYYKLANTGGVTALVGTRIYPNLMPQNPTLPAVVYTMVDNIREERHRGATGDARPKFQLTCWATTALAAAAVATQVRYAVTAMTGTIQAVVISGVWNVNELRGYEPDTLLYYSMMDFEISHKEAVA